MVFAGAVGAFLSRYIARPLEQLAGAAGAVARGDLGQHVPIDSDITEIHRLGTAFNDMTANLLQSEKVKNAFIADVTHELRTPLTVINGTLETLEDGAIDDLEGRAPLMNSMHVETRRLIRLVNDLLVLTRADAGALNLKFENVHLGALVCARCEHLAALAEPRQVKFNFDVREPVVVWGDPDRLTQVLDNLLDNAIRHTPPGSTVAVVIQRVGQEIRCAISDEGPGIPEEQLPFIFERFYRVDSARDRHSGGSGLGLAIVHSLVLAHGGRVTVESTLGQGTTLTFWLPAG
jgi:signal transduction histidine kinase